MAHSANITGVSHMLMSLYDRYRQNQEASGLSSALNDINRAGSPDDLDYIRSHLDDYGLRDRSAIAATGYADTAARAFEAGNDQNKLADLASNYNKDYYDYKDATKYDKTPGTPGDFLTQFADKYGSADPKLIKQLAENVTAGSQDAFTQMDKNRSYDSAQNEISGRQNFNSGVSDIFSRLMSGKDPSKFGDMGTILSQIKGLAGENQVKDSDVTNAGSEAMKLFENTYGKPSTRTVGRTTAATETNAFGNEKPIVHDTLPAPKVDDEGFGQFSKNLSALRSLQKKAASLSVQEALTPDAIANKQKAVDDINNSIKQQTQFLITRHPELSDQMGLKMEDVAPKPVGVSKMFADGGGVASSGDKQSTWMAEAKKLNPSASAEDLTSYYNKKYGKGKK